MTPPSPASAEEWTAAVLRHLPVPAGHTVRVREEAGAGPPAVLVTLAQRDGSSVTVELTAEMTREEAVVHLADQLQESVLEITGGAPAPPCPAGHGHPAVARPVAGVASWVCPRGEGPARPVLD